jgi:hypothetical protein
MASGHAAEIAFRTEKRHPILASLPPHAASSGQEINARSCVASRVYPVLEARLALIKQ